MLLSSQIAIGEHPERMSAACYTAIHWQSATAHPLTTIESVAFAANSRPMRNYRERPSCHRYSAMSYERPKGRSLGSAGNMV